MTLASGTSQLIQQVYDDLDLVGDNLVDVPDDPYVSSQDKKWTTLGDWLLLAHRIDADKIFFVNDDPVLVFSTLPDSAAENDIMECYRRAWSLARPRCLFLGIGDELRVYSLASPPRKMDVHHKPIAPLAVVTQTAEVLTKLANFHRNRLESGVAFEAAEELKPSSRADRQLVRDVRSATAALHQDGLELSVAHSLIERVILVRYLEDRGIITEEYFESVVSRSNSDTGIRDVQIARQPNYGQPSVFISLLEDKAVTYELFDQLAKDFNGDLFVTDADERDLVTDQHLRLLMRLLQGTASAGQQPLFFWAYDFSVIPTNLISTMYEIFHRDATYGQKSSTYYTPPDLVEFVLSEVLDDKTLRKKPRICDPACGSGIFLVEGYRRIVRYEMSQRGDRLQSKELKTLLLNRIAGCDLDEAAVRLAAFSLYVAYLNYQTPQDIRKAGPLPPLIHRDGLAGESAPLVVQDAFADLKDKELVTKPEGIRKEELPWWPCQFDVVVGNPPWTRLSGENTRGEEWARENGLAVGNRNPSQLFLWRALDLLKTDGKAAILIGANAIFNRWPMSVQFRSDWLDAVALEHVINFSQVRREFFATGVAPFMLVRFRKKSDNDDNLVVYESAKRVPPWRRKSSALVRLDRQIVPQMTLHNNDHLWKTYSVGSIRDEALLARLDLEKNLESWIKGQPRAHGFQLSGENDETAELSNELEGIPILKTLESWGEIRDSWYESPDRIPKWVPEERLLKGLRLLVRLGVSPGFGPHARLISKPMAYRHVFYAVSLDHLPLWQAKIILGTLLSSLGRYWLYMKSGYWGIWQEKVLSSDILSVPIRLPEKPTVVTDRIINAVDALDDACNATLVSNSRLIPSAMSMIDKGVFDLFELNDLEIEIITDFWSAQQPDALEPLDLGSRTHGLEIDIELWRQTGFARYLKVFLGAWNQRLRDLGQFSWTLRRNADADVVAVVLETQSDAETHGSYDDLDQENLWEYVLRKIGNAWDVPDARSILRYGVVRIVTDTAIIVVKRNERRLWSASAARQDADATAAQLMATQR